MSLEYIHKEKVAATAIDIRGRAIRIAIADDHPLWCEDQRAMPCFMVRCQTSTPKSMGTDVAATNTDLHGHIVRIAIVDDHPMIVDGLADLCKTLPDHAVVHTAHSGDEFLEGLKAHTSVDVAIVDLQMEGMDGFAVLERLREERPEIRAMAFSFNDEAAWVQRAIGCGARAYVRKNTGREELRLVLGDLVYQGFHYSELVRQSLAEAPSTPDERRIDWNTVPRREVEFARHLLVTRDPTYKQIAERMGSVSVSAVDGYFRWFSRHYGTRSRTDLVRLILLSPPPPRSRMVRPRARDIERSWSVATDHGNR